MARNGWRWLGLAVIGLMLVSFVAACGGDDDDDGGSGNGTATGTATTTNGGSNDSGSGSDNETPTASGGSDSGDNGGSDNGGSDSGSGSSDSGSDGLTVLQQTASSLDGGTYDITYDITSSSVSGTFTFASEPPNSLLSIDGTFQGQTGTFSIITLEDATYFCNGTPGQEMCLKLAKGNLGAIPFQLPSAFDADQALGNILDQPGVSATKTGSKTIAGINADCYDVTSTDGQSGSFCVGNNVILSMEANVDGEQFAMEATTAETDASKIDIQVPDYPVTDMTGLGN